MQDGAFHAGHKLDNTRLANVLDQLVDDLEKLESRFKDGRFKPCAYILDLKSQGKWFYN